MFLSTEELSRYTTLAKDGEIGKVSDLFFDNTDWYIRYLLVDLGRWLPNRQVPIIPIVVGVPDRASYTLQVELNREQVKNSPTVSPDEPLTRHLEMQLHDYYGWPAFGGGGAVAKVAKTMPVTEEHVEDPNLRRARTVVGYHALATDSEIGRVDDLIIDDESWIIRYIFLDTRDRLSRKRVLIAAPWIEEINWQDRTVLLGFSRELIEHSPDYDPSTHLDREFERRLYEHYGRPKYWL